MAFFPPLLVSSLQIENNPDAHNPTYQEFWDFVLQDNTDSLMYIPGEFECLGFTQTFHNNAERAGIKCAIAYLNPPPFPNGHLICAVQTTDEGLWFIEPQENFAVHEVALRGLSNNYIGSPIVTYYLFW